MHYTPADQRERHAFIDRSVEATAEAFTEPTVARAMVIAGGDLLKMLGEAVVLNIEDGTVSLPNSHADDNEALTIIAIRPDEEFVLDGRLHKQTGQQQDRTIDHFKKWRPANNNAVDAYIRCCVNPTSEAPPPFTLNGLSRSITLSTALLLGKKGTIDPLFDAGPEAGFAVIHNRPTVVLKMSGNEKRVESDVLAHELIHADQIFRQPVVAFTSQKSIDMFNLRIELEAYHVGSIFALPRFLERGHIDGDGNIDESTIQIVIDSIRKRYCTDSIDKYRPSPMLLKKLQAGGVGNILHAALDFDDSMERIEQANAKTT